MKSLSTSARRLLSQLTGRVHGPAPGVPLETGIRVLSVREALVRTAALEGSRVGTLPEAMGLALGGTRATVFVDGPGLLAGAGALAALAARDLPVVVHLTASAPTGPGSAADAVAAAGESGAMVLMAANGQEAVDLALAARLAAEDALCPVAVALDVETAEEIQNLELPGARGLRALVGEAQDLVHAAAFSQELLLSPHRRRVPAWHDPGRPLLTGAAAGPGTARQVLASRRAYVTPHHAQALDRALRAVEAATGRALPAVREIDTRGAHVLLVAQGDLVEPAARAAALLTTRGVKAGAVALTQLAPFPDAALAQALLGARRVFVLERSPEADPPLTRAVRACLDRQRENARFGKESHPGLPAAGEKTLPRVGTVAAGLGGTPVRFQDLAHLVQDLETSWRSPVLLGVEMAPADGPARHPKRQVLADALRRHYPEAARLGSAPAAPDAPARKTSAKRAAPAHGVGIFRLTGTGGDTLAAHLAALLHGAVGGHARARRGVNDEGWGRPAVDRVSWGSQVPEAPHPATPLDVAVWAATGAAPPLAAVLGLRPGGALLCAHAGGDSFWSSVPAPLRREIAARSIRVYAVRPPQGTAAGAGLLLGAVAGLLRAEGALDVTPRKLAAVCAAMDEAPEPASFQAGLDLVSFVEPGPAEPAPPASPAEPGVSPLARKIAAAATASDTAASLPRFWDRVGGASWEEALDTLPPDPFLASGVLPAGTSALRNGSAARTTLPVWDAAPCTGCGACWSLCPDSAILATTLSAQALLETGMRRAKDAGRSGEPLRPLLGKLAAAMTRDAAGRDASDGAALLREVFPAVIARASLSEERRAAAAAALEAVASPLKGTALARTTPFFGDPEAQAPGSGELLALAINPDTCKGCDLCVEACEPGALAPVPADASHVAAGREAWRLHLDLPETPEETRTRAGSRDDVGPVAAPLLSRDAALLLLGGDGALPGSAEKIAVRQVLGLAFLHLTSNVQQTVQDIETWKDKISESIRSQLAGALPLSDLDILSRGLAALGRPDVDLASLAARFEDSAGSGRVNVVRVRRLVEAAQELADLHTRFTGGAPARGRLAVLVAAGPAAAWAGTFPDNPFLLPVTVDTTGDPLAVARGLLHAHEAEAIALARALRRARVELERPGEAPHAVEALAHLSWEDLDPEERRRAAPLFLIGEASALRGAGGPAASAQGAEATAPLKILALCAEEDETAPSDLLPGPGQLVVATSLAYPAHLARGVTAALEHSGPAWIQIHAPSPRRSGVAPRETLARARQAVAERRHPLAVLRHTPEEPTPVMVDLSGNPAPWPSDGPGPYGWRFLCALAATAEGAAAAPAPAPAPGATDAELARIAADYEARIAAARVETQVQMARRVQERLLTLVRRGGNGAGART